MIALWGKLQGWVAAAGVIIAALAIAWFKGRAEGVAYLDAKQRKERDALQSEYDQIDAGPADPGAAYQRLRERGKR